MRYHHIKTSIETPYRASYFTGSMLRGAFGYALKKVTCINPSYRCENCFAKENCLYYSFYEEKNTIHNYRFEIELGAYDFNFGLYIFEDTTQELPYILSALEMMLTKNGLTKESYIFDDIEISVDSQIIYENHSFATIDTPPIDFQLDAVEQDVKIEIKTPIRVKKDNRFLRDTIELEDILRSIYQRYTRVKSGENTYRLNYKPSYTIEEKNLYPKQLVRNSNRQKSKMSMDGVMGEMVVRGLDRESYRLLKIGEIIGVGKQTVMGLGRIEVEGI